MRQIERAFLFPGETICNAFGVSAGDDRMMVRTLINMLFWNLAGVLAIVIFC